MHDNEKIETAGAVRPQLPAYRMPIGSVDAGMKIAAFTVAFAQADFFLGLCIAELLNVPHGPAVTLMENYTAGPKHGLFRKLAKVRFSDEADLKAVKKVNESFGRLIGYRNHLMHGMWGYYSPDGTYDNLQPAVFYQDAKPLFLDEKLDGLVQDVFELTHQVVEIYQKLSGHSWTPNDDDQPSFIRSPHQPPQSKTG